MPDYNDIRLQDNVRAVPETVVSAYELQGASFSPLDTGSYNVHFRVDCRGKSFDLCRSNRPTQFGNLGYEAELLTHLSDSGFDLSPELIAARSGELNIWEAGTGWTLFRWMGDGPDKCKPKVNRQRVSSAAKVLSRFHQTCQNFVPNNVRGNWPIFTLPTVEPYGCGALKILVVTLVMRVRISLDWQSKILTN